MCNVLNSFGDHIATNNFIDSLSLIGKVIYDLEFAKIDAALRLYTGLDVMSLAMAKLYFCYLLALKRKNVFVRSSFVLAIKPN